jgi:hypothetical protein
MEVNRTVNAVGYVGWGGDKVPIGWPFAEQRVTLRLDDRTLQVLDEQRVLKAPRISRSDRLPCSFLAHAGRAMHPPHPPN